MSTQTQRTPPKTFEDWKCYAEGKLVVTEYYGRTYLTECKPKNVGRKNATTAEEQAIKEAAARTAKRAKQMSRKFKPMLAQVYSPERFEKRGEPAIVQPKLDGVRCLAYWHHGMIRLQSRGGDPYDVPHVIKALRGPLVAVGASSPLGNQTILDGELYIHGRSLQEIVSLVKRPREESLELQYWVYDVATALPGGWLERTGTRRGLGLNRVMPGQVGLIDQAVGDGTGPVRRLICTSAYSHAAVTAAHLENIAAGFEGSIIRPFDGPYQLGKRSWSVQKLKDWQDDDFEIIGFTQGRGKAVNCPIYRCVTEDGVGFDAVPEGTEQQRAALLLGAKAAIGKKLTVKYFQLTDGGSPQFPVGKGIREEGE